MQPLSPAERAAILLNRPAATPADIAEYEELLARRFQSDPSMPKAPAKAASEAKAESKLSDLHKKLFG